MSELRDRVKEFLTGRTATRGYMSDQEVSDIRDLLAENEQLRAQAEQRGEVAGEIVGEFRDAGGWTPKIRWQCSGDHPGVGTKLYTVPPAPVVPDGWRDALIAALAAWACADEFVAANFNKLGDAIIKYPVLQGTGNQIRARRIAREPYDGKKAAAALSEIAAMLAAAPEVKP